MKLSLVLVALVAAVAAIPIAAPGPGQYSYSQFTLLRYSSDRLTRRRRHVTALA